MFGFLKCAGIDYYKFLLPAHGIAFVPAKKISSYI
jgi:hypothetical protein